VDKIVGKTYGPAGNSCKFKIMIESIGHHVFPETLLITKSYKARVDMQKCKKMTVPELVPHLWMKEGEKPICQVRAF
jgi:hypothetical protein